MQNYIKFPNLAAFHFRIWRYFTSEFGIKHKLCEIAIQLHVNPPHTKHPCNPKK